MTVRFQFGPATIDLVADRWPEDVTAGHYGPFVSNPEGPADLTIHVHRDRAPSCGRVSPAAQLPTNWALYRCRSGYRLEILEQVTFAPRQIVLLDRSLSRADVYAASGAGLPGYPPGSWCLALVMNPFVQWWLTAFLALRARGVLLHASAAAFNGAGLAFAGPSGAGKTTTVRRCRDRAGAVVLNDERIIVWRTAEGVKVAGTPWHGELPEVAALVVPLVGLFMLTKNATNRYLPWPPPRMVAGIMSEAFLPIWSVEAMAGLLEAAEQIARAVPSGELQLANDRDVADYLRRFVDVGPSTPWAVAVGSP